MPEIPLSDVHRASRPAEAQSLPEQTGVSSSSGQVLHPQAQSARVSAPAHVPAASSTSISAARPGTAAQPDTLAQLERTPKTVRHLLHGNRVRTFPLDDVPIATPLEPHELKLVGHALGGPAVGLCKIAHNDDGTLTLTYRVGAAGWLPRLVVTLCIDGTKPVRVELKAPGGCSLDVRCEQWRSNDDWLEKFPPLSKKARSDVPRYLKRLADQRLFLWSLGLLESRAGESPPFAASPASLKALIQSMASARDEHGARVRQVLKNEGVTAATALSDAQAENVLFALAEEDKQGNPFIKGLSANDLRWIMPLHNAPLVQAATLGNRAFSVRTFLNEQVIKNSARTGTGHPYPHDITGTSERPADYQLETPELRNLQQAFLRWLQKRGESAPQKPQISMSFLRRWCAARSACDPMPRAFELKARLPFKQRLQGGTATKALAAGGSNDFFDTATTDWLEALALLKPQHKHLSTGLSQFLHEQFKGVCEPQAVQEVLKAWEGIARAASDNTAPDPRDHVLKPPKAIRACSPPLRLDVLRLHLRLQERIKEGSLLPMRAARYQTAYVRLAAALQANPLWDVMAAAAHEQKFKHLAPAQQQEVQRLLDGSTAPGDRPGSVLQLFHRLPWQAQALWIEALALKPVEQQTFWAALVLVQGGRGHSRVLREYTSPLQPVRALQALVKQNPPQWDWRRLNSYGTLVHHSDARWVPGQTPALIQALRLAQADQGAPGLGAGFIAALAHLEAQLGLDRNDPYLKQVLRDLLGLPGLDAILAAEPLQPQLQANDERLQDVLGQLQADKAEASVVHKAQELLGVWMRWRERGPKPTPDSPPVRRTAANPGDNLVEQALRAPGTLQSFMEEVQQDLRHLREDALERRDALWTQLQPLGAASAAVDDEVERAELDRQLQACGATLTATSSPTALVEQAFKTLYAQAQPLRDAEQQVQQAEKADREARAQQQPDPAAQQAAEPDEEDDAQSDAQDEDEANADTGVDDFDYDQWLNLSDLPSTAAS